MLLFYSLSKTILLVFIAELVVAFETTTERKSRPAIEREETLSRFIIGRHMVQFNNEVDRVQGSSDDGRDDYSMENAWLGQSDFEGLFEDEAGSGSRIYASSDYEVDHHPPEQKGGEVDVSSAVDSLIDHYDSLEEDEGGEDDAVYRPPDIVHVDKVERAPDLFDRNTDPGQVLAEENPDGDTVVVGDVRSKMDGGNLRLPSFEETPMPRKPSFSQWRKEKRMHHLRSEIPPFELTSSLYLVPEVKERALDGGSYVGACLVVRDDHDYIVEWINHHLSLGIKPIYLYDHLSLPPLDTFVKSFINDGRVVYERVNLKGSTGGLSPQLYAYERCLSDHGAKHTWLAFLDVDEFLIFRNSMPVQSLPAFLLDYEKFSALAVHWILFGSSGHEVKPSRNVLRSYIRCMPLKHTQHLFVKSIVNTRCTVGTTDSPHSFKHNCSSPSVRTNNMPIHGATAVDFPVHESLVIHHYATKSLEDFELKVLKGSGMRRQRGWDYFYFVDGWSTDFNFDGLKIWNSDLITKSRALDPGTLSQQLAGYSTETLEDFWGNSQFTKDEVIDYFEIYDESNAVENHAEELSYDAEEGEW